jgi:hypothetical protein
MAGGNPERASRPEIEMLNLFCLVGFSLLAASAARRLPFSYTLYVLPSLALLLTRQMFFSPLMSVSRYTLVLFPCFLMLALLLERRPRLAVAWLVMSTLYELSLLRTWALWGFVA